MSRATALKEAMQLPAKDRLALAMEIWDSLAGEADLLDVPDELKTELDHRRAAYDADPSSGKPGAQVRAELRRRT